jgi:zinc protease
MGHKIGSFKDVDDPALDLLSVILAGGESSRLYKSLVYEKQIATGVNASNQSRLDPGLFVFYAQAQPGHTAEECEKAIYEAIEEIRKNGVTERELQKAKNGVRVSFVDSFKTNLGRATLIADYHADYGDWRKLYEYLPKRDKVTVADIQRVVRKYFSDRTRTVVTLIPEKSTVSSSAESEDGGS